MKVSGIGSYGIISTSFKSNKNNIIKHSGDEQKFMKEPIQEKIEAIEGAMGDKVYELCKNSSTCGTTIQDKNNRMYYDKTKFYPNN